MNLYLSFYWFREADDGAVVQGIDSVEIDINEDTLQHSGGFVMINSLRKLAESIMAEFKFSKVVIISVVTLPLMGLPTQPASIIRSPGDVIR